MLLLFGFPWCSSIFHTPDTAEKYSKQCTRVKGRIGENFPAKLYSYTAAGQVGEDFGKIYVGRKVFRVGRIRYSRPAARFLQTMLHLSSRALFSGVDIKTLVELYKSFDHCTPGKLLQLIWGQQTHQTNFFCK